MKCKHCQSSKQQPGYGAYNFRCAECAARYLASAWPTGKATPVHRVVYARHKQAIADVISRGKLDVEMDWIEARAKELKNAD